MRFHRLSIPLTPSSPEGLPDHAAVYRGLIEQAQAAERQGFSGFWISEHHFGPYGGSVPILGVMLAAIASHTSRIRLGAGVAVLSARLDPVATAEEFAMVDVISGGRLELGVGRGFMPHEFAMKNLDLDTRAKLFNGGLDLLEKFLGASDHGRADGTDAFPPHITPTPLQDPVPIWIAVSTSLESCRRAATGGHGLMLNPYNRDLEETRHAITVYLEEWSKCQGTVKPRVLVNQPMFVGVDDDEIRRVAAPALDSYLRVVSETFSSNDSSALPRKQFDDLYPKKLLYGTPEQITKKIRFWEQLGVTDMSLMTHIGSIAPESANMSTERFCQEVMPHFKESS